MRPADNPFSAQRIDKIPYHFETGSWQSVINTLKQQNHRGAIIGPHGTGKTTFLCGLTQQLRQRGFHTLSLFINMDKPSLSDTQWQSVKKASPETFILFDGADILPMWQWWRFRLMSRHLLGIFVTSHRRKILPPIHHTYSDNELLAIVLSQLDIHITPHLKRHSQELLKKHKGNVRDVLRDLYWVYAEK